MNSPTTKRIRIAVTMSTDGKHWYASGYSSVGAGGESEDDGGLKEYAESGLQMNLEDEPPECERDTNTHMVEVDIPLNPPALAGRVVSVVTKHSNV